MDRAGKRLIFEMVLAAATLGYAMREHRAHVRMEREADFRAGEKALAMALIESGRVTISLKKSAESNRIASYVVKNPNYGIRTLVNATQLTQFVLTTYRADSILYRATR